MTIKEPTIVEITEIAKLALCRELGVSNALRFLQGYSNGKGDYTKERKVIYEKHTLEDILTQIKQRRG